MIPPNIQPLTWEAIRAERWKQHVKFGKKPLATDKETIAILGEEFGEICRAVCQGKDRSEIEIEMIQLAACCIAWLDSDLHFGEEK